MNFSFWACLIGSFFFIPLSDHSCLPMKLPHRGTLAYTHRGLLVRCRPKCVTGTTASLSCNQYYTPKDPTALTARCLPDGSWFPSSFACVPVCGKSGSAVSLIVNGPEAPPGAFPWHVAIYNHVDNRQEFWCGGSLVSERAVITAAHCTWKVRAEDLTLGFGKFRREIDSEVQSLVQLVKAARIEALDSYQDAIGNYNADVSVIFLDRPVSLNNLIGPVCLDWEQKYLDEHLKEGTMGTVLGWGLTENDTLSDHLRILRVPVASDSKCIAEQENDFRKFISYTSFCAGYRNGTGVCNGDSGGGLAFWDTESSSWYLQGLVSISPRRKGTPFCDPNYYTVFTKVSLFVKWLEKLGVRDGHEPTVSQTTENATTRDPYAFIRHRFDSGNSSKSKKAPKFPHTKKMLQYVKNWL